MSRRSTALKAIKAKKSEKRRKIESRREGAEKEAGPRDKH